jgi:hypothetical protein
MISIDTTDPNYVNDGGLYQYEMSLWNTQGRQNISLIQKTLGKGGFNNFLKLANVVFVSNDPGGMLGQLQATNAVLGLKGVLSSIDALLNFNPAV